MMMGPYLAFGTATHLMVQDAAAFAHEGEELCFWQMQVAPLQHIGGLQHMTVAQCVPASLMRARVRPFDRLGQRCFWEACRRIRIQEGFQHQV